MQSSTIRGLPDLFTAAEAVRYDQRVLRSGAHRWQQTALARRRGSPTPPACCP
jgi:hypothetical protein